MNNLILQRISPELISLLKEVTIILKKKGKKPTKAMVCKILTNKIRYHSTIIEDLKNE